MAFNTASVTDALKALHPDASEEEINQKVQTLASGEDPVLARQVVNHLYSPERRSQVSQEAQKADTSIWGGLSDALGAIGTALQGGNAAQTGVALRERRTSKALQPVSVFDKEKQEALAQSEALTKDYLTKHKLTQEEEDRAQQKEDRERQFQYTTEDRAAKATERERASVDYSRKEAELAADQDVNSPKSKMMQEFVSKLTGKPIEDVALYSAHQLGQLVPQIKAIADEQFRREEAAARKEDRQEARLDREQARKERAEDRKLAREQIQETRNLARQDRLQRQEDIMTEKRRKDETLSDKQVSTITGYDNVLNAVQGIRQDKGAIDTGKIAAARNSIAAKFGLDDAKVSTFKANLSDQLAQYVKSISGSAVSEQEAQRLAQSLPSIEDNDTQFIAKLDAFEKRIRSYRATELSNLKKRGKNVSEFEEPEKEKPEAPKTPASGAPKTSKPSWAR